MQPTNETETFFVLMDKDGRYAGGPSISSFSPSLLDARKFSGTGAIKNCLYQMRRHTWDREWLQKFEPLAIVRVTGSYTYSVPEIVMGVE